MAFHSCRWYLMVATLPAFAVSPAMANLPPGPQKAADLYLQELARVQTSKGRVSMEPLFARADSLDEEFFPPEEDYSPQGNADYLKRSVEGLSDAEVDSLNTQLRGVEVIVGDYVFTYIDAKFFLALAESHGLPPDVAFLRAYAGRGLGSELIQDCVHFGKDLIVNQYAAWVDFQARYPNSYSRFAGEETQNVKEQLMGTCACDDSSSVTSELDHFLLRFPRDPIAADVRTRLASIRQGSSDVTFNCPPPHYR